jgi:citrate synthase
MKYTIVPIETLTKDPNVIEVCKMLGYGEIPQNAAQAAAWNLANGMSWQELAVKNRVELKTIGYAERFFAPQELFLASRIVGEATQRAKDAKPTATSPGEQPYTTGGLQAGGQ